MWWVRFCQWIIYPKLVSNRDQIKSKWDNNLKFRKHYRKYLRHSSHRDATLNRKTVYRTTLYRTTVYRTTLNRTTADRNDRWSNRQLIERHFIEPTVDQTTLYRTDSWSNRQLIESTVASPAHSHSKTWRTVALFAVENWNLVTFHKKCSAICPCLFDKVGFCNFWDIVIFI